MEDWLTIGAACAIAAMMGITTVDVIMRKVLMNPMEGSYEYVTLLFVGVVFLGLAYTQRTNQHIQIGILYDRLPRKARVAITAITLSLSLGIFVLTAWSNIGKTMWAIGTGDTILGGIPVVTWPSRLAVPIGTGFLSLRLLVQLVQLLRTGKLIEEADIPNE